MIGVTSGIITVYIGLILVGIIYAILIYLISEKGYLEGYTSLAVVGGVLVTLAGVYFIFPLAAAYTLGAFVCTGTPMIIGDWLKNVRRRAKEQERIRAEANDSAS